MSKKKEIKEIAVSYSKPKNKIVRFKGKHCAGIGSKHKSEGSYRYYKSLPGGKSACDFLGMMFISSGAMVYLEFWECNRFSREGMDDEKDYPRLDSKNSKEESYNDKEGSETIEVRFLRCADCIRKYGK